MEIVLDCCLEGVGFKSRSRNVMQKTFKIVRYLQRVALIVKVVKMPWLKVV